MVDAIQLKTAYERGVQRGMQEAMERGMQHVALRVLTHRFGEPPASIRARLQGLQQDSLEDLALELLDFSSYAEVEQWMTRH